MSLDGQAVDPVSSHSIGCWLTYMFDGLSWNFVLSITYSDGGVCLVVPPVFFVLVQCILIHARSFLFLRLLLLVAGRRTALCRRWLYRRAHRCVGNFLLLLDVSSASKSAAIAVLLGGCWLAPGGPILSISRALRGGLTGDEWTGGSCLGDRASGLSRVL
jgi:hypothetical protein